MMSVRQREGFLVRLAVGLAVLSLTACAAMKREAAPVAAPQKAPQANAVVSGGVDAGVKQEEPQGLEPREERRLSKELGKEIEEYYRLLKDKNIDGAVAFVEPQFQKAYIEELWTFTASYAIEGIQSVGYQFFPRADGLWAKVKIARTLFEKGSVVPQRSEVYMTWVRRGDRWLFQPLEKK